MTCSDNELLRQYTEQGDETAFAEVVRRHTNLVYGTAWRVTGEVPLAQEVTQIVFTLVAREAGRLCRHDTLIGWLYTTTRHRALDAVRGEKRRRARDQEAHLMQNLSSVPEPQWEQLRPLLDEALDQLGESDRTALLLRFFKDLSHEEVGAAVGLNENSAQKRVDRALEKLRVHFARQGVTASAALLGSALAANAAQVAPEGLGAQVAAASLAGGSVAVPGSAFSLTLLFMSMKSKILVATAVVLVVAIYVMVNWPSPTPAAPAAQGNLRPVAGSPTAATIKLAQSGLPAKIETPVAAPVAASNAKPAATAAGVAAIVDAPGAYVDVPQSDLKTAISSALYFLTADDVVGAMRILLPPQEIEQQIKEGKAGTVEEFALQFMKDPDNAKKMAELKVQLEAIQGLDPKSNDGSAAIYELDPPTGGHIKLEFEKVDGYWFLK